MNLLLDTHAWLWFHLGEPHLSTEARRSILDPSNTKYVSPASFWDISIKIGLGKYSSSTRYATFMHDSIVGQGFHVLPITPLHTEAVSTLPVPVIEGRAHRDPFDRLLIAQAMVEHMSLVRDDGKFSAYEVPVVW